MNFLIDPDRRRPTWQRRLGQIVAVPLSIGWQVAVPAWWLVHRFVWFLVDLAWILVNLPARIRVLPRVGWQRLTRWRPQLELLDRWRYLMGQARRVAKTVRKTNCELVVAYLPLTNIIALLAKVLFIRRLHVVVNVHSFYSQTFLDMEPSEAAFVRWLIRKLYPRADLVVVVAEGIRDELIRELGVPAKQIEVIHNPLDLEGIGRRAKEAIEHPWLSDPSIPLVVAVGRLVGLKRFDVLIEACASLVEEHPVRLLVLGDGEERSALEKLVRSLDLEGKVEFLGHQTNPWKYMARAELFVLSSDTEGLPNVIGEAMAVGLPVVATDCSLGVREYLENGSCGVLVEPGNPAALAEGMRNLLEDAPLRAQLAERGRQRVLSLDLGCIVPKFESTLIQAARSPR